jgi:nucleotide-binding universal stress UspA family protein
LLNVSRDDGKAEAAEFAAEFLDAHGVDCQLHVVNSHLEPAEVVLQHVRNFQPRLVVMGAHAHHPLRDLFATSVTRAVLRGCPVPVLIGA